MKTIVYSKITNLPCGEVLEGDTPQDEILRSAIPSFGGTESDYDYIEVSEEVYKKFSKYEFTIVNGEIVFGNEKVNDDQPAEPSPLEKLQQDNILLKAQNQALIERTDFHEELIAELAMFVYP
ncbi:hypothetical protein [Bacillus sp. JJ1474]|uniref:hypothetical protein n=1 Tax=Bacillus sp. JJ1474 TaxID=3122955 RepID=UPI00300063ED